MPGGPRRWTALADAGRRELGIAETLAAAGAALQWSAPHGSTRARARIPTRTKARTQSASPPRARGQRVLAQPGLRRGAPGLEVGLSARPSVRTATWARARERRAAPSQVGCCSRRVLGRLQQSRARPWPAEWAGGGRGELGRALSSRYTILREAHDTYDCGLCGPTNTQLDGARSARDGCSHLGHVASLAPPSSLRASRGRVS